VPSARPSPRTPSPNHNADGRDFFVVEIPFVNWMRDRMDADVLLLVTTLTTGSGGQEVTAPGNTRDPWNFRVFRLSGNASMDGEQRQSFGYFGVNASARRTTAGMNVVLSANLSLTGSQFVAEPERWSARSGSLSAAAAS
jgi:hypothetical protein